MITNAVFLGWGILLYQFIGFGVMDDYGLNQQQFAYAFGINAGIMLFSTLNKKLAHQFSVLGRLKIGGMLQPNRRSYFICCRFNWPDSIVVVAWFLAGIGLMPLGLAMWKVRAQEPPVPLWAVCSLPVVYWVV